MIHSMSHLSNQRKDKRVPFTQYVAKGDGDSQKGMGGYIRTHYTTIFLYN